MSDVEAETVLRSVHWTHGKPDCPHCSCDIIYEGRRPYSALRFRCKACRGDFSITSGTLFAHHKMSLRNYLAATAIFVNVVKGKSALALSRDLDCQYKTAFVLSHKMREAMAFELKQMHVDGEGETVETDGMYVGGYIKPASHKENRRDRRLVKNQNGKRKVVVAARERGGRILVSVFKTEVDALGFIIQRVNPASKLVTDEATSWNALHSRFDMARIDHGQLYSTGTGTYSNGAEEFFSRMRRVEIGHHHHIPGAYLIRYAQESA